MSKKIKKNKYAINSPGSKKIKEQEERIKIRLEARTEMLAEFTTILAWVLRADYHFGKKRIEQLIEAVYEMKSDTNMEQYGQELLKVEDMPSQLLDEVGLDINELISKLVEKHLNRVKEKVNEK